MAKVSSDEKVLYQFPASVRVLAIDNDPKVLEFIKSTCKRFHYQVITCTESPFALNLVRERKDCVDVILMEVHMPNMNGYEFLQHVSKEEIDVPVIMMSLDHDKNSVLKVVLLGACDFWIKPLNENQFKNMLMHVVRKALNENNKIQNLEVDERRRKRGNDNSVSSSSVVRDHPTKRSSELNGKCLEAVVKIALDEAVPERILEEMNVPGLTRENVASHLQKYRHYLKTKSEGVRETETGTQ